MLAPAKTQLVVIGAGPGGYAAAFHAADRGMDVTLVDAGAKPGGVCLHRGCIPSKALLHVAALLQETRHAKTWGLSYDEPEIDLDRLRKAKNEVIDKLARGVTYLAKQRKVNLLRARAAFTDSQALRLESDDKDVPETLSFDHAIVATGSVPVLPKMFQVDGPWVMNSTSALDLPEIPKRLLVVGGGYIGLELGSVYAALGSEVTVVELLESILPGVDSDLVRPLQQRLRRLFKAIHVKTQVTKLEPKGDEIIAHLEGGKAEPTLAFDRVLVAVGRKPKSASVGLDTTAVTLDEKGFIQVDSRMRTSDPRILAIGDVTGEPMLAHKASREAKVAVEALAGEPAEFDNLAIPAVVFTDPEIAWCGLTEPEAKAEGREVRVTKFPWTASGRAQTLGRVEGLTKLIFDPKTERLLGMGIVGAGAGELISEGVLAVEMGAVARDLADSIHPHPTLTETVMEAAESFLGQATHLFVPKR
jgi:dihydrolipoamide dehydrogenase